MIISAPEYRNDTMTHYLHIALDQYMLPGISALVMLSIFSDISEAVPIVSGVLLLCGQGVRWYRDDVRKEKRHRLYERLVEKMLNGEIPYDSKVIEKLSESAD